MKMISKVAATGAVLVASFLPMTAAHAECEKPYCTPNVPSGGGEDGGVLPSEAEKPAAVTPTSSTSAPSGELPFTGGDVVGLTIIGAGALGLGTIMVRRSKAAKSIA